jgi:hypothetical protein
MRARLLAIAAALVLALGARGAEARPLTDAQDVVKAAVADLLEGAKTNDMARIRRGLEGLAKGIELYRKVADDPAVPEEERGIARSSIPDTEKAIAQWSSRYPDAAPSKPPAPAPGLDPARTPHVFLPNPEPGESLEHWCERVKASYAEETNPRARAAVAARMAEKAKEKAGPALLDLLKTEKDPLARSGLSQALAAAGGEAVAARVGDLLASDDAKAREAGLETLYAALRKPERVEPEKPWCKAVRRFHERKQAEASLDVLLKLDALGWSGVAALGEVLCLDEFGAGAAAVAYLSRKRDGRAVPPLLRRAAKGDKDAASAARQALASVGWHAVPELIRRLGDPAVDSEAAAALRRVTGQTFGPAPAKWEAWWKGERAKHPEVDADPEGAKAEGGDVVPASK